MGKLYSSNPEKWPRELIHSLGNNKQGPLDILVLIALSFTLDNGNLVRLNKN